MQLCMYAYRTYVCRCKCQKCNLSWNFFCSEFVHLSLTTFFSSFLLIIIFVLLSVTHLKSLFSEPLGNIRDNQCRRCRKLFSFFFQSKTIQILPANHPVSSTTNTAFLNNTFQYFCMTLFCLSPLKLLYCFIDQSERNLKNVASFSFQFRKTSEKFRAAANHQILI